MMRRGSVRNVGGRDRCISDFDRTVRTSSVREVGGSEKKRKESFSMNGLENVTAIEDGDGVRRLGL